jgi:hypothetical protein
MADVLWREAGLDLRLGQGRCLGESEGDASGGAGDDEGGCEQSTSVHCYVLPEVWRRLGRLLSVINSAVADCYVHHIRYIDPPKSVRYGIVIGSASQNVSITAHPAFKGCPGQLPGAHWLWDVPGHGLCLPGFRAPSGGVPPMFLCRRQESSNSKRGEGICPTT